MAGRHESNVGLFSTIAVVLVLIVVGVVAGMVRIPPYFANRDVQRAIDTVVHEVEPINDNGQILNAINTHLNEVKATRFWVEGTRQLTTLGLQLSADQLTVTRDGNRSMTIDVTYTQGMWVPILNRVDTQTYHAHADSLAAR